MAEISSFEKLLTVPTSFISLMAFGLSLPRREMAVLDIAKLLVKGGEIL